MCTYKNKTLKISRNRFSEFLSLFHTVYVNFSKNWLIFILFYCFCMLVKNFSHISGAHTSERKRCFNIKSSTYYFHVKTKMLENFHICISVPLISKAQINYSLHWKLLNWVWPDIFGNNFGSSFSSDSFL